MTAARYAIRLHNVLQISGILMLLGLYFYLLSVQCTA